MQIARYYCPTAQETFSLLPDCLASRFPSDLDDLERVVIHVEGARSPEALWPLCGVCNSVAALRRLRKA
jgi:hypothetical protein